MYMDDALAGIHVYGNIVYNVSQWCIHHGGMCLPLCVCSLCMYMYVCLCMYVCMVI